MKERKTMKKMFALVLAFAMLLTMSTTVFAETNADAKGSSTDKVNVTITKLTGEPTVTLYQIAKANYSAEETDGTFTGYTWATGIDPTVIEEAQKGLTAANITKIVNGINAKTITPIGDPITTGTLEEGTYTYEASAGAYIAVITGATDGSVYNPILLTATYNASGLVGGDIAADSNYLYGTTSVAKGTWPNVDKVVSDTTVDDSATLENEDELENGDEDDKIDTVSVGDIVTYTLNPVLPSYPADAVNKTLYISDTLTAGLTFIPDSLEITLDAALPTKLVLDRVNNTFVSEGADTPDDDSDDVVVATLVEREGTTFNLNFVYDELITNETTGLAATVQITYKAVVNDGAVVGSTGNANTVTMYYANNPTVGNTYDPSTGDDPSEAEGVTSDSDKETVYTYQIALHKVDAKDATKSLEGAVFNIYDANNVLVDTVVTNKDGYAVSSKVAFGTYKVQEIVAPEGYSLNTTPFYVEASWTEATTTVTSSTTATKYSIVKPSDDAVQVGWIVEDADGNGVFYKYGETVPADAKPAYIVSQTSTDITTIDTTENNTAAGNGTVAYGDVNNTPMSALPSTGGVGTVIFTVAGCLIMVAAVAIFMVSKKKVNN